VERRVAIVTGGASGIGRATVDLLEERDVEVVVFDQSADPAVDVSDEGSVGRAVDGVRDRFGRIDIVVNAAGTATGGTIDTDGYVDAWERAIAVNLTGTMLVVRACIADLVASGAGRIVNVASTEALASARNTGPYSVSKIGVIGFTRSLAVDFGRRGVTANCVCPGSTLTGMTADIPEERRSAFAARKVPVGRYAEPAEIAFMIAALTDPGASYVNGAVIPVDGGLTASTG